ncbi:hypothetical protein SISSUDRAFT_1050824 [Sistotremastrum suecicum HHB10207 ss-3]|uniref:Uncharacterized protein n=1 Tax=Sistotremastrum suecicum HHB10207 ss-3 TaxID=1314776 RepID=A0A166AYF5_9AGAM|nr:hypothetical protein SISSUDRAFT_1050824 [Sistotremastrum suecicum HHB10207 ss-3]
MSLLAIFCVLALTLRPVRAQERCFENAFGDVNCSNPLSTGVRVAIAIGSAIFLLTLLSFFYVQRRRRINAYNQRFVTTPVYAQQTGTYPLQQQNLGYQDNGAYDRRSYPAPNVQAPEPAYMVVMYSETQQVRA